MGSSRSGPTMAAQIIRPGAPTCWRTPNARSNSWVRPRSTEPSCSLATPAPWHGPRPLTSMPATSATRRAARPVRSGFSASGPSPPDGAYRLLEGHVRGHPHDTLHSGDPRSSWTVQVIVGVRSLTAHECRFFSGVCVSFRSPTSMDLAPAAFAPQWTGSARNTAPGATRCF